MKKENINVLLHSFLIVFLGFLALLILNFLCAELIPLNKIDTFEGNELNVIKRIFYYDSYWYESIVNDGYMKYTLGDPNNNLYIKGANNGMANWAFFPMLPLVIKILKLLTFNLIGIEYLGFIFSFVCNVFFIYNLIQYFKEKNIRVNHLLIFLIFIFSSLSMYLYTLYTETLVMLLIILLIRNCDKKRYLLCGLLCSLLTFSKVQGCFWCIYLFIHIFKDAYVKDNNILKNTYNTIINIFKNPIYLLSIAISPLGLFAFLSILKASGLHALSFSHIQAAWDKENGFFLFKIFEELFINQKLEALVAISFMAFIIYLIIKKKYLVSSILAMYLISACTSSVASITRYAFGSVILLIEIYAILVEDYHKIIENKDKNKWATVRLITFATTKVLCSLLFLLFFFEFNVPVLY